MGDSSASNNSGSKKHRYVLQVHVGSYSRFYEALSIEAEKNTPAREIVDCICEKLCLTDGTDLYALAEVIGNQGGQECKERRLGPNECPIALKLLWPKKSDSSPGQMDYRFCLRRIYPQGRPWPLSATDSNDSQLIWDYFLRFLYHAEYPDLCQLPDLTEQTLLNNLKSRFEKNHIYTYVGSILIAVNPFTFYPIYNPKYVQLYQNRRLGDLPPHIFAIADAAYQSMLRKRTNQCIVISGESGSGKTESTNLLLHHLTALSQKGSHGSGVEQTILGAGPVLEAFGNAKTKFNNNSSRFGKFIQVNYKENGAVHGALVQKYLLEKSRIVSQVKSERNYHVFYHLLEGLSPEDKDKLYLTKPQDYFYLNQSKCYTLEGIDERHEFSRLTQSMEMVGFTKQKQFLCFRVLSAVLHLGNVQFSKKSTYHSDETVMIKNPEAVTIISKLLDVKEETLTQALTCKKTKAAKGEMLVINYKLPDAIATRDAMAKCLYGALFDWIVMQVNHALLSKKDSRDHKGNSIGVLDIFGFEDFGDHNNFEQFCINYANERLQYYFNQHVFKYEQEEYQREGISWRNIDFNDNTECLRLIEDKPDGLLYLLDDQCNFPCGSNETILQKFIYHHNSNPLFEVPPCRGSAFTIKHYAGKVKYQIRDFREKNLDLMRPDIVAVLKVSQMSFVRELVCTDSLAFFRWRIMKAFFSAYFIFSKLRELSKVKRGLTGSFLVKEFSNLNQRRVAHSSSSNTLSLTETIEPSIAALSSSKKISTTAHRMTGVVKPNIAVQFKPWYNRAPTASIAGHWPIQQCVHGVLMRTTSSSSSSGGSNGVSCPVHGSQAHLCSSEARVLSRANKILMKKKYSSASLQRSKCDGSFEKSIRNFKLLKQLLSGPVQPQAPVTTATGSAGALTGSLSSLPGASGSSGGSSSSGVAKHGSVVATRSVVVRKQTQTVTHQFQQSLQHLMDTLSHANPFFVRCIKSNADKTPNHFDDRLVLQQLRYTGMLETVRIRQSGYSVRLTFDEFIQHYRILLPKGLLSSKMDVQKFLLNMKLPQDMYQIGETKVFMRESEKLALDERLHEEILGRIINLQRWVRTWICRKRFNEMRSAAVTVQTFFRRFIAQKRLKQLKMIAQHENWAANAIQKHWRAYQTRKWFTNLRRSIVRFQSACRGHLFRNTGQMEDEIDKCAKQREEAKLNQQQQVPHPPPPPVNSQVQVTIRPAAPSSSSSSLHAKDYEANSVPRTTNEITVHCDLGEPCAPESNVECDLVDDDFENDDCQVRLNRNRNVPIRKTSFKRKANNNQKSLSDDKLLATTLDLETPEPPSTAPGAGLNAASNSSLLADDGQQPQHRHLTKLSSDSKALCASTSSFLSSGYLTNSDSASSILKPEQTVMSADTTRQPGFPTGAMIQPNPCPMMPNQFAKQQPSAVVDDPPPANQSSVGPIQKAKATFRNIMGGKSETNKRFLKQTLSVKSGIDLDHNNPSNETSGYSNHLLLGSKSLSNNDLGLSTAGSESSAMFSGYSSSSQCDMQQSSQLSLSSASVIPVPSYPQQQTLMKSKSQDGKFTLLSRHSFHEDSSCKSGEICAICENPMVSGDGGGNGQPPQVHLKCNECKQLFHKKCLHASSDIPCIKQGLSASGSSSVLGAFNPPRPPRNKQKKAKSHKNSESRENTQLAVANAPLAKQSVRVKQFTDSHDVLIADLYELQLMDEFISKKIREMDDVKKKTKESMIDVVFKQALKEFKSNLISTYSVGNQDGYFRLTYKDLIDHFEQILINVCHKENTYKSFPVIMGVNAIRGYMDELRSMNQLTKASKDDKLNVYNIKKSNKRKQNKKVRRNKKEEDVYKTYEHEFYLSTANIYTVCEVCGSYVWLMEKIFICRRCKLTCQKKCFDKVSLTCGNNNKSSSKLVFGAPLASLVSDGCRIPLIVEQLITKIELKGLYTEGIFRKSARRTTIDELKQLFDSQRKDIDLDHYSVHVLAGCLKLFFREMPEPLMTYELYDDFLWATTITDPTERNQVIFNHISKLPKANYDLLERLTFHLARVSQHESANRMNANSLAIVFAPCILRTNKVMQMQDKLKDISKQTICIESIISERMRQISDTLNDIDILDTACHTATSRLSSIRHSKLNLNRDSIANSVRAHSSVDDEEVLLAQKISELITEKDHLTTILPTFRMASACSDEDILSSNENELEMATTNASSEECLTYEHRPAIKMRTAELKETSPLGSQTSVTNHKFKSESDIGPDAQSSHLTKNRVNAPQRRRPSRQPALSQPQDLVLMEAQNFTDEQPGTSLPEQPTEPEPMNHDANNDDYAMV